MTGKKRRASNQVQARLLSIILVLAMVLSVVPVAAIAQEVIVEDSNIYQPSVDCSVEQLLEPILLERQNRGVMGFEGEYALSDSDELVSVIVLFESDPAGVQVAEAGIRGRSLSEDMAESIVEAHHTLFRQELDVLFGSPRGRAVGQAYEIRWEYHRALNGVNIVLPSNMVGELDNFASVRVVYPDVFDVFEHYDPDDVFHMPEEVEVANLFENIDETSVARSTRNPPGVAPGRADMRADQMHTLGYRGDGVVVALIDSGIYYYHPAFAGRFLTLEEMNQRNPYTPITEEDTIYNIFYGRCFRRGRGTCPLRNDPNDPMETRPERDDGRSTNHGTRMAGIIVGQDTGGDIAILGVAPEARIIMYRVSIPTVYPNVGSQTGYVGDFIAAVNQTFYDSPDVVNMSIQGGTNFSVDIRALAVHNVILENLRVNQNITYVIASGNTGIPNNPPGNTTPAFYTTEGWAAPTMAITVANARLGYHVGNNVFVPSVRSIFRESSRGPVGDSFEIKPDIAAHGVNSLTTTTPWPNNARYGWSGGTSSATAHVSGAVALLIDYSRRNGGQWTSEEIKVRLMNNAHESELSPFIAGAGFINVYAAAHAHTVVSVIYDRVVSGDGGINFHNRDYTSTKTGSFSFGGAGMMMPENIRTLKAEITNNSGTPRTYTLSYSFNTEAEGSIPGKKDMAELTLSAREITVGSEQTVNFTATISLRGDSIPYGFFQGRIYVHEDSTLVARLPWALVNEQAGRTVDASRLSFNTRGTSYQPTVPTTIDAINVNHGTNIKSFLGAHHDGFSMDIERPGRKFMGWYVDANFTTPLTPGTYMPVEGLTLYARWDGETVVSTWQGLREAINAVPANTQATILIADSFAANAATTAGNQIVISSGRQITLQSTVTTAGENNMRVLTQTRTAHQHIIVDSGASLTLGQNITLCGGIENITRSGGVFVQPGGSFTMKEGSVIENCYWPTDNGGGVLLQTGTATSNAVFNLEGGIIRNNTAARGGGVILGHRAEMTMSGGYITGNTARGVQGGGGIQLNSSATLTITGGEISNNTAANQGGGIRIGAACSRLYMTGGSIINNTAVNGDGGGIFTISHSAATNLLPTAYGNLTIGSDVLFSGNKAINRGPSAPPNNTLVHIAATTSSIWNYALNNYDINYVGRLGQLLRMADAVLEADEPEYDERSPDIECDVSFDDNDSDEQSPDIEPDAPSCEDNPEYPSTDCESDEPTHEDEPVEQLPDIESDSSTCEVEHEEQSPDLDFDTMLNEYGHDDQSPEIELD